MAEREKKPGNGQETAKTSSERGFSLSIDRVKGLVKPGFLNTESANDLESLIIIKHYMEVTLNSHIAMLTIKALEKAKSNIQVVSGSGGGILNGLKNKLNRNGKLKM